METEAARNNLLSAVRLVVKTLGTFGAHLWSAALNMFRTGDLGPFLDVFVDDIRNQLTRAWNEGARSVGVDPDEFSPADREKLEAAIEHEYQFVLNLAQAISDARLVNMPLEDFRSMFHSRIDLWSNRYREMVNAARMWFGGKATLGWVMGKTEEHCPTCSALNGIVAYAEEWLQADVRPQAPENWALACGGWRCECTLSPTDQRRSPRAFDRIMRVVGQ